MSVYEELGIRPFINASEPYTRNGGSVMHPKVIEAMAEAAGNFIDMGELIERISEKAARLTKNEGAFVTSGAGAGVALAAAACICISNGADEKILDILPNTQSVHKNEILIFKGKYLSLIQYWKLIRLSGANLVLVDPTEEAMVSSVNDRTAGVFLFPAPMYEEDIPTCEEIVPKLRNRGIPIVIDAAAQLPPVSNLQYYTKTLGADLAIFSGGKHIKGPQSTGLIVGRKDLTECCKNLACPNPRMGRAFKTGKEELIGFIKALELFINTDPKELYARQEKILLWIQGQIEQIPGIHTYMQKTGRLGTEQPLLLIDLPGGKTGEDCNDFTRTYKNPVDIGFFKKENGMPNTVFINAYLLQDGEEVAVAEAIQAYMKNV